MLKDVMSCYSGGWCEGEIERKFVGEFVGSEINRIAHVVHCDRSDLRQRSNKVYRWYYGQDLDVAEPLDDTMPCDLFSVLRCQDLAASEDRR